MSPWRAGDRAPIVVLSFDRADYLEQVLATLMRQRDCDVAGRDIYLLQDGARNAFSGRAYATDAAIAASVAVFRRLVPGGSVKLATSNLGVALNFERAERLVYEELNAPAAIFLEDDMVLSDQYVATLDRLIEDHLDDERVGYVAAYGDHRLSLDEQLADPSRLDVMHHLWAFASFQRQWRLIRPYVEQYLALVRNVDYRARDHDAVRALFAGWGFGCPATSQDAAKTLACVATGTIKVNTRIVLGCYIGERGLHMTRELFERRGHHRTVLFPDPVPPLRPITPAVIRAIRDDMLIWAGRSDR